MEIRPYTAADREACLAVFDSNVPDFFRLEERPQLEAFLADPRAAYFVMEHDGAIAGCGGHYRLDNDPSQARLIWGMVRRELHRHGLGRFLLLYRIREITKMGGVQTVRLDTSQHAAPFFQRQGFKTVSVEKDGYGPGNDRVVMAIRLTVCP